MKSTLIVSSLSPLEGVLSRDDVIHSGMYGYKSILEERGRWRERHGGRSKEESMSRLTDFALLLIQGPDFVMKLNGTNEFLCRFPFILHFLSLENETTSEFLTFSCSRICIPSFSIMVGDCLFFNVFVIIAIQCSSCLLQTLSFLLLEN